MAKNLNQDNINFLKTELLPEILKVAIPQLKSAVSLIISKELSEQEEKYERKLDEFKNEFFERVDPVLKEVVTSREERPIIENRLEALEEIHRSGKHSLPAS